MATGRREVVSEGIVSSFELTTAYWRSGYSALVSKPRRRKKGLSTGDKNAGVVGEEVHCLNQDGIQIMGLNTG